MADQYIKLPDGSYAKFPDTMSDGDIAAALRSSATPAPAAVAPSSDLSRMHMMGAWMASPDSGAAAQRGLSLAADAATKAMPTAGGILGGALGGVPGALLGGAAGEAYRQLLQRLRGKPDEGTATGAAGDIATAGAVQGAAQAVGAVAQPLLEKAGQGLMQTALKPGMKALRTVMTGKDAVPPVVQTLLDEGVNVTPGGLEKLRGLIV